MKDFFLENKERIVVVSKNHSLEEITKLYNQGFRIFGENRVQELLTKIDNNLYDINWHLIGHLQTNKVEDAVVFCDLIHSVDSIKLAKEINKQAKKHKKIQKVLIQINVAKEETKFGIRSDELKDFLKETKDLENILIQGIMVIGPCSQDVKEIRRVFKEGRELFASIDNEYSNVDFQILSMGMSNDYLIADECGSTLFRLGRVMFDEE